MKIIFIFLIISLFTMSCHKSNKKNEQVVDKIRFFSNESFWNQPIGMNAKIDTKSAYWISLLERDPSGENFGLNVDEYTIPIYEVDSNVQHIKINQIPTLLNENGEIDCEFGHSIEFDRVKFPMPDDALPSPGSDQHLAVYDRKRNLIWDMFLVRKDKNGEWESATGMVYPLDGDGVFNKKDFNVELGTSIHGHGPGVAAGMPIVAGVIRYSEIKQAKINHKLSGGVRFVGFQEFVYPAIWTDGNFEGGIPEGAVIQLDPELDLNRYDLTAEEIIVAKALQEYGVVIVDFSAGSTIRVEYLDKSRGFTWRGKLRGWKEAGGIKSIPVSNYRVLEVGNKFKGGDKKKDFFKSMLYLIDAKQ